MAEPSPRHARDHQLVRPSLLGTTFALLVQFLLGMTVNLFVTIPKVHPGTNTPAYFSGVVAGVTWAVAKEWPWLALHAAFGLVLVVGGLTFLVRAWRSQQAGVFIACAVSALAAVAAAFNGASFLNYGHASSSMIMAASFALAIGSYTLALFLAK